MTEEIPNLWPSDISISIVSPVAILNQQASRLRELTRGLLEARVKSSLSTNGMRTHQFQIIAQALDYTYDLFRAWHDPNLVYPVTVEWSEWLSGNIGDDGTQLAYSPSQFITLLQTIFQSSQTKSVIHSLLARINDSQISQSDLPVTPP